MNTVVAMHKSDENVVFFPNIFNQTMDLLLEAQDYFYHYGDLDQSRLENEGEEILYSCEMSRITMRLSCVMAWLLVRKAVLAGKLSEKVANARYRLDSRDICLSISDETEEILPSYVNYLLDESYELYERVARLDDMLDTMDDDILSALG
jgi:regulator of CtrA degradation